MPCCLINHYYKQNTCNSRTDYRFRETHIDRTHGNKKESHQETEYGHYNHGNQQILAFKSNNSRDSQEEIEYKFQFPDHGVFSSRCLFQGSASALS